MSSDLTKLAPYDDDGALRVIVESPRGSAVKLKYEPALHTSREGIIEARDLPPHARAGIEQFFVTAAALTGKRLQIKGWASRRRTEKFLREHTV